MANAAGPAPRILVVEGRFYEDIADEMFKGAAAEFTRQGAEVERISVPGALEIPAAIHMAIRSLDYFAGRPRFDGFVALGCVIRGETSHYDHVCGESIRKLQDLACQYVLALGCGILTCENEAQAWERAQVERKNKGGVAARACLRMLELKQHFHLYPR
ncbi:MAG: 6,7-dimethyl-8-ribityllumazine synthase [Alphaproteobacteria bacterium]